MRLSLSFSVLLSLCVAPMSFAVSTVSRVGAIRVEASAVTVKPTLRKTCRTERVAAPDGGSAIRENCRIVTPVRALRGSLPLRGGHTIRVFTRDPAEVEVRLLGRGGATLATVTSAGVRRSQLELPSHIPAGTRRLRIRINYGDGGEPEIAIMSVRGHRGHDQPST